MQQYAKSTVCNTRGPAQHDPKLLFESCSRLVLWKAVVRRGDRDGRTWERSTRGDEMQLDTSQAGRNKVYIIWLTALHE